MFFVGSGAVGRLPHYPFNHSLPALEQSREAHHLFLGYNLQYNLPPLVPCEL